jgi:hypothetical protein
MAKLPIQADVVGPQTDEDLNAALEDSFPASDPVNTTMSGVGTPAGNPPTEPVTPHPLGGAEESDLDEIEDEDENEEEEVAGDDELEDDEDELDEEDEEDEDTLSEADEIESGSVLDRDTDLTSSDDDVASEPQSGFVPRS